MSIGTSLESDTPEWEPIQSGAPARSENRSQTDVHLVEAARDEIQQLASQISRLSSEDLEPEAFFTKFLQRVVSALASVAGAVWQLEPGAAPHLTAQVNLDGGLQESPDTIDAKQSPQSIAIQQPEHTQLLRHVVESNQSFSVPPGSGVAGIRRANSSNCLILLVPLSLNGQVLGIVEIFQRAGRGPATEHGFQRFLERMSSLACDFLRNWRLRQLAQRLEWSRRMETFLGDVHQNLNVQQTSYAVVNESRRLIGCDRVSLALGHGRQCRIVAVSGLDSLDRRAAQVRQLEKLAARVIAVGEPKYLPGNIGSLAPQLETYWNRYVDMSHVRQCAVIPLFQWTQGTDTGETGATDTGVTRDSATNKNSNESPHANRPIGAMIIERMSGEPDSTQQMQRAEQLARHSGLALTNSLQHDNVFLLPLWRGLGAVCQALGGRHYPKTLLTVVLLMATIFAMTTLPADFTLPVRGRLQPASQQTVFARQDGVILAVPVRHGQLVAPGQILVQMRNTDLEVEIAALSGKQTSTREQILATQRALLDNPRLDIEQQNRLQGELLQLKQVGESTQQQLDLVRQKEQQLTLRVERAGRVSTWQVRKSLLRRPVQKGQALLAVVDPESDWELELYVPEQHIGHLTEAIDATEQPLLVTFILSSHPGQMFQGSLLEVDRTATSWDGEGSMVRVRVAVDKQMLPEMRSDATVVAKLHCGQRSLGYTWFHDLIDTVRGRVMFWLH